MPPTRGGASKSILAAVLLDTLDYLDKLGVDLLGGLDTADLGDNVLGAVLGHDLGQFLGLLVFLNVLETESHLNGVEEELDGLAVLGKLSSRADKAFLAGQLAQGSTADTLDGVLQMGVANALEDLVDVGLLCVLINAVLGDDEGLGLLESAADFRKDVLVLKSIVDGLLTTVVAVVGSSSVASVDSEELALNVRSQVADPVDAVNLGDANVLKGSLVDDPLKELLQGHIKTSIGVLGRDDTVNGRVGVAGTEVVVLETRLGGVLLDELCEGVGGADGILAGNDVQGSLVVGAELDTLGDDWGDELEDAGTDGAGDDLGGADLLNQVGFVGLGVDGAVICDGVLGGAF